MATWGLHRFLASRPHLAHDLTSSLAASVSSQFSAWRTTPVGAAKALHTSCPSSNASDVGHSPLQSMHAPPPASATAGHSPLQSMHAPPPASAAAVHSPLQSLQPSQPSPLLPPQPPAVGRGSVTGGLIKVLPGRQVAQGTPHLGLAPVLIPTTRSWVWYDERDERKAQAEERRRQWPDLGHAHLSGIPQSQKKMDRILRLVRGLHFKEAVIQCKSVPHKATRFVLQALDHAREDAIAKELNPELLIVALIWSTRGVIRKAVQPMGKGKPAKCNTQSCNIQVVLRPDKKYSGFRARLLTPVMQRPQPLVPRPSFAYHDQV